MFKCNSCAIMYLLIVDLCAIIHYAGRIGRISAQSPGSTTTSPRHPQRLPSLRFSRHWAITPRHTAPYWRGSSFLPQRGQQYHHRPPISFIMRSRSFFAVVRQMCATAFLLLTLSTFYMPFTHKTAHLLNFICFCSGMSTFSFIRRFAQSSGIFLPMLRVYRLHRTMLVPFRTLYR